MNGRLKADMRLASPWVHRWFRSARSVAVFFLVMCAVKPVAGQNASFLQPFYFDAAQYILNLDYIHSGDPDKNLFNTPYDGSVVYIGSQSLLAFIVDPAWCRIVYGNYKTWAKGFGGYGSGNGQFAHPGAVVTDGLGNLYVADTYNGRVVQLFYDAANEEITSSSFTSLGETVLSSPKALDVDDRGNTDPSDDHLWVIDNSLEQVIKLTVSGQHLLSISSLYNPSTGATYNDLSGLSGIAVRKNPANGDNSTSDTPGHVMRVSDHAQAQGAVIGKAMSALESGRGLVLVLVTLQ